MKILYNQIFNIYLPTQSHIKKKNLLFQKNLIYCNSKTKRNKYMYVFVYRGTINN